MTILNYVTLVAVIVSIFTALSLIYLYGYQKGYIDAWQKHHDYLVSILEKQSSEKEEKEKEENFEIKG